MEIINKGHEKITSNQRIDLAPYFKLDNERVIYFSAAASQKYGIFPGLYMHFVNDDERWYFYCNSDSDGFKIIERQGKNCAIVCNISLVALIKKRKRISYDTKFPVKVTPNKLYGSTLCEIDFSKPFE